MDRMTVIVPLDGSAASEQALPTARALAGALQAWLQLVYVVEEPSFLDGLPGFLIPDQIAAERYLTSIARNLPEARVTTRVLRGNAAAALLDVTRDALDTLLVMATHGRGSVGRLVFGSVTDKVVREATVPVVTVRVAALEPPAASRVPIMPMQTIVVAVDGSDVAECALPLAATVARATGATLHLVRVIEPFWRSTYLSIAPEAVYLDEAQVASLEQQAEEEARAYLDRLAGVLRVDGLRVAWEARVGRPAEELARAVDTIGADLLVLATHGRGGLRRWALGSVTTDLLQRGGAPMLVVRPLATADPPVEHDRAQQMSTS